MSTDGGKLILFETTALTQDLQTAVCLSVKQKEQSCGPRTQRVLLVPIVLLSLIMTGFSADRLKVHTDTQSQLHISFPLALPSKR